MQELTALLGERKLVAGEHQVCKRLASAQAVRKTRDVNQVDSDAQDVHGVAFSWLTASCWFT